jgi:hypothetical protein
VNRAALPLVEELAFTNVAAHHIDAADAGLLHARRPPIFRCPRLRVNSRFRADCGSRTHGRLLHVVAQLTAE